MYRCLPPCGCRALLWALVGVVWHTGKWASCLELGAILEGQRAEAGIWGRLNLGREGPGQGSPRRSVENQEGMTGASTGAPHLALHTYSSSAAPRVTSSSVPVQKVASESQARNTAAAPTWAGWPTWPRGWEETGIKEVNGSPRLTPTPHTTWVWSPRQ